MTTAARIPDCYKLVVVMLLWLIIGGVSAQQLNEADARFFLLRTGFAPERAEVDRFSQLSRRQAVEKVLAEARPTAATPAPGWIDEPLTASLFINEKSDHEKESCVKSSSAMPQPACIRSCWH
jgi:uncharacterized protein (DUF1800 family)